MASDLTTTINATGVLRGAFATLAEYQTYVGKSSQSAEAQAQITAALLDARVWIEQQLHRRIVDIASGYLAVEQFAGNDRTYYVPIEGPIDSITTVEEWNGEDWAEIDDTLTPLTDGNWIYFQEGNIFARASIPYNWRITYTFGYPSIPKDIKRASMMLAEQSTSVHHRSRLQSQSDGEQSFSYWVSGSEQIVKDVMRILTPYIRYPSYGGHY